MSPSGLPQPSLVDCCHFDLDGLLGLFLPAAVDVRWSAIVVAGQAAIGCRFQAPVDQ